MILSPEHIKSRTIDICTKCSSPKGVIIKGGKIYDCDCSKLYKTYLEYSKAGIEEEYWEFSWEDLDDKFKKENKDTLTNVYLYKNNSHTFVSNNVSLLFTGSNGSGKTIIGYLLLKDLIKDDYYCRYVTAEELGEMLFIANRDEEVKEKISEFKEADFLVIDELQQFTGSNLEILNKLSNFLSNQLKVCSIIFISNSKPSELKMLGYGNNFIDRLKNLEEIEFKGKSYRQTFESKFKMIKEKLTDKK